MAGDMMAKQNHSVEGADTAAQLPPVTMRSVHADKLSFEGATSVISSAQKFILPIPDLKSSGERLVYPSDSPKAGTPIVDYKGNPIGDSGVVFFNHKDKAWQAVPGDGAGVIIINEVSRNQAVALLEMIKGMSSDVASLSLDQVKKVLEHAHGLGLKDMYNSTTSFITSKMTPVESALAPGAAFGFMKRDDRDVCQAVFISGAFAFDGPSITPQLFDNGGVIVKQGSSIRGVQPDVFQRTYRHSNGAEIANLSEIKAVE